MINKLEVFKIKWNNQKTLIDPDCHRKGYKVPKGIPANGVLQHGLSLRRQLGDAFIADCLEIWALHGKGCLVQTATEQPATFVKIMAGLMPKEIEATVDVGQSFVELLQHMQSMNNQPPMITIEQSNDDVDQLEFNSSIVDGMGLIEGSGVPCPADTGGSIEHNKSIFPHNENENLQPQVAIPIFPPHQNTICDISATPPNDTPLNNHPIVYNKIYGGRGIKSYE